MAVAKAKLDQARAEMAMAKFHLSAILEHHSLVPLIDYLKIRQSYR
jgi:hypothetical protein